MCEHDLRASMSDQLRQSLPKQIKVLPPELFSSCLLKCITNTLITNLKRSNINGRSLTTQTKTTSHLLAFQARRMEAVNDLYSTINQQVNSSMTRSL